MTPKALEKAGRTALETMTTPESIGAVLGTDSSEAGVVTMRFQSDVDGYGGWEWVVSLAVEGDTSTILETELVAGEGALRAPDWVPWADRLREYEESLAAGMEDPVELASDDEDDDDDDLDDDEDDLDDDDEDELEDVLDDALDDTDVFDGIDDAVGDDEDDDEYVVVDDKN